MSTRAITAPVKLSAKVRRWHAARVVLWQRSRGGVTPQLRCGGLASLAVTRLLSLACRLRSARLLPRELCHTAVPVC